MAPQRGRGSPRSGGARAAAAACTTPKRTRSAPTIRTTPVVLRLPNKIEQFRRIVMAPLKDPNNVDEHLKDVVQHLYNVQSTVHGYLPESQEVLVENIIDLTHSLSNLSSLTAPRSNDASTTTPNGAAGLNIDTIQLPPEILDYVDGGRNPDVYTREFVELVQRGNAVLNGKQEAFCGFSEIFARELKSAMPEMQGQVDRVMGNVVGGLRGDVDRSANGGAKAV